jgi:hypothetical protein
MHGHEDDRALRGDSVSYAVDTATESENANDSAGEDGPLLEWHQDYDDKSGSESATLDDESGSAAASDSMAQSSSESDSTTDSDPEHTTCRGSDAHSSTDAMDAMDAMEDDMDYEHTQHMHLDQHQVQSAAHATVMHCTMLHDFLMGLEYVTQSPRHVGSDADVETDDINSNF